LNKMGAAEQTKYRIATTALETIPSIIAKVEANPDAFGMLRGADDLLPDFTANMITKPIQAGLNAALTDDQQRARVAVYQQAYEIINSLAGAALSKTELGRIEDFTPSKTDSLKTVVNKLRQAEEFARGKHEGFKKYSDYEAFPRVAEEALDEEVVASDADAAAIQKQDRIAEIKAQLAAMDGEEVAPVVPQPQGLVKSRGLFGRSGTRGF